MNTRQFIKTGLLATGALMTGATARTPIDLKKAINVGSLVWDSKLFIINDEVFNCNLSDLKLDNIWEEMVFKSVNPGDRIMIITSSYEERSTPIFRDLNMMSSSREKYVSTLVSDHRTFLNSLRKRTANEKFFIIDRVVFEDKEFLLALENYLLNIPPLGKITDDVEQFERSLNSATARVT